ncbi:unnamed protein product [Caenorhabditis nigoni]
MLVSWCSYTYYPSTIRLMANSNLRSRSVLLEGGRVRNKNEFMEELLTAENKYFQLKRETEEAINEKKQMQSFRIRCALTAAVYQDRSAITEWSKFEDIISELSSTVRFSLKCQFPGLQNAFDLCREIANFVTNRT